MKPSKKRVDRKSTPVSFDSTEFEETAIPQTNSDNMKSLEKKKTKGDPDSIISPTHPKWNRVLDLKLRGLVSQLGTLSWKAVSPQVQSSFCIN